MAPVGKLETHYGTSDGGNYAEPLYVGSTPVLDRKKTRAMLPLQYIEKATTPTFFWQGKDDERCPKCQSEEFFVSLCRAGDTPAELVLRQGEDHSFLGEGKPACRADAAARFIDWLDKNVLPQNSDDPSSSTGNTTMQNEADKIDGGRRQPEYAQAPEAHVGTDNQS